jgi:hypothetical protein
LSTFSITFPPLSSTLWFQGSNWPSFLQDLVQKVD